MTNIVIIKKKSNRIYGKKYINKIIVKSLGIYKDPSNGASATVTTKKTDETIETLYVSHHHLTKSWIIDKCWW